MSETVKPNIEEASPSTRHRVLLMLKQRGGMTAAELAEQLNMTSMGARRHLMSLEREQLVQYQRAQRGKGRPSYVYQLTSQAESLFPKNYAALANDLLGFMAQENGESAVERLFARRAERRMARAVVRIAGLPLGEQVAHLAQFLAEEGYLAEWHQVDADTFWLTEHNCAIHDVAVEFRAACASELTFLRAVLPATQITRVHHLMGGALMCAYRIERQKDATDYV